MYFFFHLVAGVLLGFLLGDLLRDGRWIVPCAVGAILPDLIDKPLGYVLLPALTGYGRLLFHSLPLFLFLLAIGILLWRYRGSVLILAADIGIFSHQALDTMWTEPAQWLDPLVEPIAAPRNLPLDFFLPLLQRDLGNPTEWFMAGVLILGLFLYIRREHVRSAAKAHGRSISLVLQGLAVTFAILGGLLVSYGLLRMLRSPSPRFMLNYVFPLIAVLALAAFLFWRWGSALGSIPGGKEA